MSSDQNTNKSAKRKYRSSLKELMGHTGFPLEFQVGAIASSKGWITSHSVNYADYVTGEPRELDLVATRSGWMRLRIECKALPFMDAIFLCAHQWPGSESTFISTPEHLILPGAYRGTITNRFLARELAKHSCPLTKSEWVAFNYTGHLTDPALAEFCRILSDPNHEPKERYGRAVEKSKSMNEMRNSIQNGIRSLASSLSFGCFQTLDEIPQERVNDDALPAYVLSRMVERFLLVLRCRIFAYRMPPKGKSPVIEEIDHVTLSHSPLGLTTKLKRERLLYKSNDPELSNHVRNHHKQLEKIYIEVVSCKAFEKYLDSLGAIVDQVDQSPALAKAFIGDMPPTQRKSV